MRECNERGVEQEIENSTKEKIDEKANNGKPSIEPDLKSHLEKKSIYNWTIFGTTDVRDD